MESYWTMKRGSGRQTVVGEQRYVNTIERETESKLRLPPPAAPPEIHCYTNHFEPSEEKSVLWIGSLSPGDSPTVRAERRIFSLKFVDKAFGKLWE